MSERKILVFENLPLGTTSSELTDLLSPLGQVSWAYIKTPEDGRHNHTGYAEMSTEKEATKVIVKWNGLELKNHVLRVKHAPPNFDRATMGEAWRKAKPPSLNKPDAKVKLSKEKASENDTDKLMVTSSSVRANSENKTVQYNRRDLVEFKPNLDKNSNYDEIDSSQEPKSLPPPPLPILESNSKEKLTGFNSIMIIFTILALTGLAYAIYFFWSKM